MIRSSSTPSRRGTIYLAVLGVALIVGALAAAAIHVARIELHHAVSADEMDRARLAAQSGIEYAISRINNSPLWRTAYDGVAGPLTTELGELLGTGSFAFTLTDSDGDLEDDYQDSATLRSVGMAGDARSVVEVLLLPAGPGLDCLDSSLHSAGQVKLDQGLSTYRVSSNGNIEVKTGRTLTVSKDASAVGTISGTVSPSSAKLQSKPPREMPDPESVFEYYKIRGTWITLPDNSIERVVLGPISNPFPPYKTNLQGIYVVDCQGASITLRDCRIVGTLVLLNAGSGTSIKNNILMEPAALNFPALIIQGPLEMDWDYRNTLVESALDINLNPVGLPPLNEIVDDVLGGLWLGELKGLVYLTGNLDVKNQSPKINGVVVVGGTVNITSQPELNFDSTFFNNPPPGFAAGPEMQIIPGTWKRVAIP